MANDPLNLLRLLEPAIRPDGMGQPQATPRLPIEQQQDFAQLLADAQEPSAAQDFATSAIPTNDVDADSTHSDESTKQNTKPLAGLSSLLSFESDGVRRLVTDLSASHQQGSKEAAR